MRQDKRSKTARVAAVLAMAKARGRPVTRAVARRAVAYRAARCEFAVLKESMQGWEFSFALFDALQSTKGA